jgi:hypothetical protein
MSSQLIYNTLFRIDGAFGDMSDKDVDDIGLQFFNSIPKIEYFRQPKNNPELLIEDLGDIDSILTDPKRVYDRKGDEKSGRETDRSSAEDKHFYAGASSETSNGHNIPSLLSPQGRRQSPIPKVQGMRVKSIFTDSASSILPVLCPSAVSDLDYSSSVNPRVSVKNQFNLEEPNTEESFPSGGKFLSPDERRQKNRIREGLKGNDSHLPHTDLDRNSPLPAPERWKQRRFSGPGPGPHLPLQGNFKMSQNASNDDEKMVVTQHSEFDGESSPRNVAQYLRNKNIPMGNDDARYSRRPLPGGSKDNDSDNDSSKSDSDDNKRKIGTYGQYSHILSPGRGQSQSYSQPHPISTSQMPQLGQAPRKKSLTPLHGKMSSNFRDSLKRAESLDSNLYRPDNESNPIMSRLDIGPEQTRTPGRRDSNSEGMRGLQMQKILSSAQNAQLQKEVDALQKQLAQLEELEGTVLRVT